MKLVLFIDTLSSHQEGLCNAFYHRLGEDFKAVFLGKIADFRKAANFEDLSGKYQYAHDISSLTSDDQEKQIDEFVNWADVGIVGGVSSAIIDKLLVQDKKVFLFSERFYKKGTWRHLIPTTLKKVRERFRNNPNFEVLCASAYLPYDLKISGYKGKTLQWGYFPQVYADTPNKNSDKTVSILWAGRLIPWKHPETCILLAERLAKANVDFRLTMVGYGDMKSELQDLIRKKDLSQYVEMKDALPPQEVHRLMCEADIYLATSDYNEGWGVVVNEAMTAGCALVASSAMGSVPYMIKNRDNGFVCDWDDIDGFYNATKLLIENADLRNVISRRAVETMKDDYSPETAADRFCRYFEGEVFTEGVCSTSVFRKEKPKFNWRKI